MNPKHGKLIKGKSLEDWVKTYPLLEKFTFAREIMWFNPKRVPFRDTRLPLGMADIDDASKRLQRFAPYIAGVFPETETSSGIIESPLVDISKAKQALETTLGLTLPGRLMMKRDDQLPISGSIKARGGIYEVLKYAETIAVKENLLTVSDDYQILASRECKQIFGSHALIVGSTGNLGLSIGIMGAQLGFKVTVHMSADARQWKKDLLRRKGVKVIEHEEDYGKAVRQGRLEAEGRDNCHFIDDENSTDLFLGYSVAGERLKKQFTEQGIVVDKSHPLCVYLPCGVGGGPGGIVFGLKQAFGDAVHCFFAEPTHSASMFLGMYTGRHDRISVQDFGIDNITCADGLAVGRPSAFVGRIMESLIDGIYTVSDEHLYAFLALIREAEGIELEPSALAGLPGIANLVAAGGGPYFNPGRSEDPETATHLVWATGGNMVPRNERNRYYQKGKACLRRLESFF